MAKLSTGLGNAISESETALPITLYRLISLGELQGSPDVGTPLSLRSPLPIIYDAADVGPSPMGDSFVVVRGVGTTTELRHHFFQHVGLRLRPLSLLTSRSPGLG